MFQKKQEADRCVEDLNIQLQCLQKENERLQKMVRECTCQARFSSSPSSSPPTISRLINSKPVIKQEHGLNNHRHLSPVAPVSHPVPDPMPPTSHKPWTYPPVSESPSLPSSQESSSSSTFGSEAALDLSQPDVLDLSQHKQDGAC